ncbi:hypothetical protein AB4090_04780 [Acidithiobacillus sp. IBUN Pt1247-S3]|uniref:hypothetical protein n=1 Tax=Acidithiobacillus sp. IBUN Pt1247-S3 TaxID=3166642 RepID=UPI0034E4705B
MLRRTRVAAACALALWGVSPDVSAGILSGASGLLQSAGQSVSSAAQSVGSAISGALGSLAGDLGVSGILQTGKAVNTGQTQQMAAQVQQKNQILQESVMADKKLLASRFVQQYLNDTAASPLGCGGAQMGAANLQSVQAQSAQAAGNTFVGAHGWVPGNAVTDEPSQQLSGPASVDQLAEYTQEQNNASALFNASASLHQATVEQDLLNPLPPQPLTRAQGDTAAGQRYQAQWNIDAGALSVAAAGLGTVASMHTFTVPGSAVQNAATVAGVPENVATAAVTKPAPSLSGTVQTPPPAPLPPPSSSSGGKPAWAGITPIYWQQIARAAAAHNLPPAMMAAQVGNEDGTEDLKALAIAGSIDAPGVVWRDFNGYSTACYPTTYQGGSVCDSAKSLFQMINTTASSYGLTNPMWGTTNAQQEINAAANGYTGFYSSCNGNLACVWSAWAVGHAQATVPATWMSYVQKAYANYRAHGGTWTWTGHPATVSGYVGGNSLYDTGSGNGSSWAGTGNGASAAGLLRMTSYGSYANPQWIDQLNALPMSGVWKVVAYLQEMQNVVENDNRKLLEHYVAIVAERNALLSQKTEGRMNTLRATAMRQYASEPVLEKLANDF